jgi:aminopeptidase N
MRIAGIALLASFAAPCVLAAQSNAELMANDHYTRSHDYDLVHQGITVGAFNWDSTSFEGSVTTTLIALRPRFDSAILDEGALLENTKVVDRTGRTLRTSRHGDTLVVFPATPAAFGDTVVFTVTYHGKIKNGSGLTYITTDGIPHRPRQIWSQGEDHDNHYWFPTYDFPNDKMTWEVIATVDKSDFAVSNGRLVSDVAQGAKHTLTWNQERPSATYLVSLVVAPLAKIHDTWQGIPVDYYTYHEDSANAWRLFHETPDMIGVYSQLTGTRYPWAKYAQTTVADFFGGMENVSATTLVDWLPDAKAYQDRPWYQYILIPHELAHQWFGDYVTTNNWANMWLNEGFAEFMPGQYWGTRLGAHAEQDYYVDEYRQFMQIEARRPMPVASLGSNNIYPKGALVLEMLKHYLGERPFWASIHEYLATHAQSGATSDDLRQAVLAATGENLDWFWNEWVYQAGFPKFTVAAAYDTAGHALTLTVKQTQTDSLKADTTGLKFTVPQAFRMPLTIRVGTAKGDVTQRVWLDSREQKVTIPVSGPPTMVIFDDGNAVLKELEFDEPTAWLATQLASDADLWNRSWVIRALHARPADAAAGAALSDAAQHADYFLTRQQAVEALDTFPVAVSGPALQAALKDTSAPVRTAALRSLEEVPGAKVADAAHAAFESDPSYAVRAAALRVLVRADSAGAHAAIVKGIATTSYQDVIQSAALRAIFQVNDTSLLAKVDSMVATQQLPLHLLAALGTKGSTHALDLLAAHLNDPRSTIRQWTLQAYQSTLANQNKAMAVSSLKAVVDGIRYADTKKAATDLLVELQK